MKYRGEPTLQLALSASLVFATAIARSATAWADLSTQATQATQAPETSPNPPNPQEASPSEGTEKDNVKAIQDRLLGSQSFLDHTYTNLQRACDGVRMNEKDLFVATVVHDGYNAWMKASQPSGFLFPIQLPDLRERLHAPLSLTFAPSRSRDRVRYRIIDSKTRKTISLRKLVDELAKIRFGLTRIPCDPIPNGIAPAEYAQIVPDFGRERALREELNADFAQLRGSSEPDATGWGIASEGTKEGSTSRPLRDVSPSIEDESHSAKGPGNARGL